MSFSSHILNIANNFTKARTEPFKQHKLANLIRRDWPRALINLLLDEKVKSYKFDASPGLGQWSEAPWLAALHPAITKSAMAGFYPVYLFEPGFKTVCLVMGQGAQSLSESLGKKNALIELKRRAKLLREMGGDWGKMGFSVGPFSTLKAASEGSSGDADKDSWSVSVAYGKRYFIEKLPSDKELKDDLIKMLSLYDVMANLKELNFVTIDVGLADLKSSNELPSSVTDGAIKTLEHVKFEKRERNRKIISAAKKKLGYVCQACNFSFAKTYGDHMAKFIEAHHIVPLSSLPSTGAELTATEDDFMMLCSNCHRAIHRAGCPNLTSFIKTIK